MKVLAEYWQGLRRARLSDEFKQPAAQPVVGLLTSELGNELVDVLRDVGQQEVEAVFLLLRIATTHQPHGALELLGHLVESTAWPASGTADPSTQLPLTSQPELAYSSTRTGETRSSAVPAFVM